MPKFLDAPSWYDSAGTLKTITDTVTIFEGGGSLGRIEVPVTQVSNFPNGSTTWTVPESDSSFAVLYNHPSSWGPCWSSAPATTNSVLAYTGSGLSWKPMQLYLHTGRIYRTANPSANTPSVDLYYNYYSTSSFAATSSSSLVSALGSMGLSGANYRLTACGIYKTSTEFYYISYLYIYQSNIYIGAAPDGGATQNLNTSSFVSYLTFSESVVQLFH